MADADKPERYFDRYEIVAVAVPGAAALLLFWYLHPEFFGSSKFDASSVSLGTLGLFAVASFVAGQVVAVIANLAEEILNWCADRFGRTPVHSLPEHLQKQFNAILVRQGVANPDSLDRVRYRKQLGKSILHTVRTSGKTRILDAFNIGYGTNRGLAAAFGVVAVASGIDRRWQIALFLALLSLAFATRAYRFSRRFEGEALRSFIEEKTE